MGGRPLNAELIADRGAAAETGDFFRSRAFYDAEGVTHTLRIEAPEMRIAAPLIARGIPRGGLDAISPYGYPGASVKGDGQAPDRDAVDWSATGLVSIFIRERLGARPCLAGGTRRSVVQVHDPAEPRRLRARFREQIRRNERRGYAVELVPGPATDGEQRGALHAVYTETMRRAGAAERYLFRQAYFDAILSSDRSWLALGATGEGAVASAAVIVESDGLLHYYLGGTAQAALRDSPFKNLVDRMVALADERSQRLNLGGGMSAGDGLEDFKRGFANTESAFLTHEVICDPDAYARLSAGTEKTGFFPAYRAPAVTA